MVTFFLGLDGLDCDLVEKWDCQNLMQHEHGKITVPIHPKYGIPLSPHVWACFLTGQNLLPKEFKGTWILKLLRFLRKLIPVHMGLGEHAYRHTKFPKLEESTFLDLPNTQYINAPYYDYDHASQKLYATLNTDKAFMNFLSTMYELYDARKTTVLTRAFQFLKRRIAFAYMEFPDSLQHCLRNQPDQLKKHYLDLDEFVWQLHQILPDSTTLIVVSDHGYDAEKEHSNYGYYSSSKPLNPQPEKITDFYKLVTCRAS